VLLIQRLKVRDMKAADKWRGRWDTLLGAAIANPVAFFFVFRSLTWALALVIIYTGSAPEVNLRYQPGLLMYAALQLALGTLYAGWAVWLWSTSAAAGVALSGTTRPRPFWCPVFSSPLFGGW